ncbi:hypothetical protein BD769DRAFT_972467 [Suillus cothurnatus]|nr:hypothetical protein BD769DRAFT_972467 [Suillus cothurnatus]
MIVPACMQGSPASSPFFLSAHVCIVLLPVPNSLSAHPWIIICGRNCTKQGDVSLFKLRCLQPTMNHSPLWIETREVSRNAGTRGKCGVIIVCTDGVQCSHPCQPSARHARSLHLSNRVSSPARKCCTTGCGVCQTPQQLCRKYSTLFIHSCTCLKSYLNVQSSKLLVFWLRDDKYLYEIPTCLMLYFGATKSAPTTDGLCFFFSDWQSAWGISRS